MSYPACDFCGTCLHCPDHGDDCVHPCPDCGADWMWDQPACVENSCPSHLRGPVYWWEQLCLVCGGTGIDEENSFPAEGPSYYSMGEPPVIEPCICQFGRAPQAETLCPPTCSWPGNCPCFDSAPQGTST